MVLKNVFKEGQSFFFGIFPVQKPFMGVSKLPKSFQIINTPVEHLNNNRRLAIKSSGRLLQQSLSLAAFYRLLKPVLRFRAVSLPGEILGKNQPRRAGKKGAAICGNWAVNLEPILGQIFPAITGNCAKSLLIYGTRCCCCWPGFPRCCCWSRAASVFEF